MPSTLWIWDVQKLRLCAVLTQGAAIKCKNFELITCNNVISSPVSLISVFFRERFVFLVYLIYVGNRVRIVTLWTKLLC